MTKRINIFLSYKWEDEDQKLIDSIEKELKNLENINIIRDKNFIDYTDDSLYEKILTKLEECDCLIVPLSSINKSWEVMSELIRAHEKCKEIIILSDSAKETEKIPKPLFFLNGKKRLDFEDHADLTKKLKEFFQNKTKKDFERIPNDASILLSELKKHYNKLNFRSDLMKQIVKEAQQEIKRINNNNYIRDVGVERNFLVRANSIIKDANSIYAVSIDKISNFWTDASNKELTIQYIKSQPHNAIRLFVFSSAKNANQYINILEASHRTYGNNGRVFFCNIDSYKNFLEKFRYSNLSINDYFSQDFAILLHGSQSNRNESAIELSLNSTHLKFKVIDLNIPEKINFNRFLSELEKLKYLDFLKLHEEKNSKGRQIYIKRWNPDCLEDRILWINDLKQIFSGPRSGKAYHLICFKDIKTGLEQSILDIKNEIESKKEELGVKSVWFGGRANTERDLIDHASGGKLKIDRDYDYLLLVEFSSIENMEDYYETKILDIRENLYKEMNDGLKFMYNLLEKEPELYRKTRIFENIVEDLASNYMTRYDFVESEDIESMVIQQQPDFEFLENFK